MSYLRPSAGTTEVSRDAVELLARLAGFTVPAEDMEALTAAFRNQLASIEALDELDLTDVNPVLEFDPRWHD